MKRSTKFFAVIVAVQLAVFGWMYYSRYALPSPPVPNLSIIDSRTAGELKEVIEKCTSPEDWHQLARYYMALGFYPEARATFGRAVELNPDSAEFAFDYAFCLSRMAIVEESNRQFQRAIDLGHEKAAAAMFFTGRNHLRDENPDAAKAAFRKSATIPLAKFELAKVLFRNGELEESESLLNEVLLAEANTIQPYVLLAQVAQQKGDRREWLINSIEGANKRLRTKSPFGEERKRVQETFSSIGYAKELRRNEILVNQRAEIDARGPLKDLQDIEWNIQTQDVRIRCATQSANIVRSVDLINERMERFGPASTLLSRLAESHRMLGNLDQAVEAWIRGGKLNTDKYGPKCYQYLARYYQESSGDRELSEKYQALGIIGVIQETLRVEEYKTAASIARTATKLAPDSAEYYFLLGRAQMGLAKRDEAVIALQKALELDPTHGRAQRQLEALGGLD